jgi:LysR family transcriptional regulator for bpeEF and oprC
MDRLDALKVFCAVVEAGAFSRAAEKLGMSTSSVTNHVAALETHFQIKLLNRTTRSMSLTDEGRQCYEHALRLLNDMSELEDSLRSSSQTPAGSLRVDLPSVISRLYVAPALPAFLAAYPGIHLKITVEDRMIDMVDEGVDVLVRIGELPDSSLVARRLYRTRHLCCASPAFLARYGAPATPQELDRFPCLGFLNPRTRLVRPWRFARDGDNFSHIPKSVTTMDHVESIIEAAKAGGGVIQQMSISLLSALRSGELVPVLPEWEAPGPDISALFQQRHQRAAKIKVFVDFLEELFAL